MDLRAVLAELRQERDAIEAAIAQLERLEHSGRHGAARPLGLTTKGLAAKSPLNGANGSFRPPLPAPREE
jgi:hypothetical protein